MVICGDTSFFFSLYGNDANSHRAVDWVSRCGDPITLSPFNSFEFGNALRFAEFRKALSPESGALYFAQFEAAIRQGRLLPAVCNLADVLDEATRLSATYAAAEGHRSFDILHVAAALVLQAGKFLTFDANQKKLALAAGFVTPL